MKPAPPASPSPDQSRPVDEIFNGANASIRAGKIEEARKALLALTPRLRSQAEKDQLKMALDATRPPQDQIFGLHLAVMVAGLFATLLGAVTPLIALMTVPKAWFLLILLPVGGFALWSHYRSYVKSDMLGVTIHTPLSHFFAAWRDIRGVSIHILEIQQFGQTQASHVTIGIEVAGKGPFSFTRVDQGESEEYRQLFSGIDEYVRRRGSVANLRHH